MNKQTRRKFTPEFKARVTLEALRGQLTLAELAQKFELNSVMISRWKTECIEKMRWFLRGDQCQPRKLWMWTSYLLRSDS